jgi:beta-alanine--pyruvate transaminase
MLARASGMYYETPEGRKILDGVAGLWCVNCGHGRKEITQAVAGQLEVMDYAPPFQIGHPAAFELANALVRIAPRARSRVLHQFGLRVRGHGAQDRARIPQGEGDAGRVRLLGRERGYHGVGFGGISVGGMVGQSQGVAHGA